MYLFSFLAYFPLILNVLPLHYNWFKLAPFCDWVIFHCAYVPRLLYLFICWQTSASMSWLLWIVLQWTLGYMCLFELRLWHTPSSGIAGSYGSLIPSLLLLKNLLLFSIVTVPIYISTNSTVELPFLHILSSSITFKTYTFTFCTLSHFLLSL